MHGNMMSIRQLVLICMHHMHIETARNIKKGETEV
jgi:hypothetical protein